MDSSSIIDPGRRARRRHSAEFKARLVALCCTTGTPIASVALANGVNANLLRRWVAEASTSEPSAQDRVEGLPQPKLQSAFIALELPTQAPPREPSAIISASITIELHRGDLSARVTLPASADSAEWVRRVLR